MYISYIELYIYSLLWLFYIYIYVWENTVLIYYIYNLVSYAKLMGSYLIKDFILSYINYFFIMIYISSFFIFIRCNDWFFIWLRLEINMFRFLLIIFQKDNNRIESSVKYFFIQSLGSRLLILRFYSQRNYEDIINIIIIRYKIGAGPFFFWFSSVCDMITWWPCFMLMSFQKLIPLILVSIYSSVVIWLVILIRLYVGLIGVINQTRIKRLLAYSSIHHNGWILMCVYIYDYFWLIYLILYSFLIFSIIVIISKNEILNFSLLRKINEKNILIFGLLSIGGIPPILGFFLKWWVFYYLNVMNIFLIIFLIIISVSILYYYIRVVYSILFGELVLNSWILFEEDYIKIYSFEILFFCGTFIGPLIGLIFLLYLNKIIILLIFKVKSVNLYEFTVHHLMISKIEF